MKKRQPSDNSCLNIYILTANTQKQAACTPKPPEPTPIAGKIQENLDRYLYIFVTLNYIENPFWSSAISGSLGITETLLALALPKTTSALERQARLGMAGIKSPF